MRVTETSSNSPYDNREFYNIKIERDDGKTLSLDFGDGEPEDATLQRDMNDVYLITTAMKWAYEAGASGQQIYFASRDIGTECIEDIDEEDLIQGD